MTSTRAPRDKHRDTWRFVVAYDGTAFVGWARQEGQRTVQDVLEKALSTVAGERVQVRAAGRTDAGVHARGQVVSTTFSSRVPPEKMMVAACSQLPPDVSVVRAERMHESFDAKRDSLGKRYVYRVHNAVPHDPFRGAVSWHLRKPLDVPLMIQAATLFVGEHDFESFRSVHCDAAHARRYLWRASIDIVDQLLSFEVRGNAFCRHMIRCLMGTLVDVGRGRYTPDDVARMLEARDRRQAGVTAPPEGLTLEEVYYPDAYAHAEIPVDAKFPGYPLT